MRLYHFLPEKYAKEALRKKRLKVSIINQLNDPFEFHAGFSNPKPQIRKTFVNFKAVISKEFGILCFSKRWNNPLLWSHYTEKHTGCTLGFEIPDNKAIEVNYSENRPLFSWDKIPEDSRLTQNYFHKLIKTKFISWEHEEEFRLFYKLSKLDLENGLYFQKFDDNLILKEVIAGCKSKMSDQELLGLLQGYNNITVIKSRMAFKSFRIVRDRKRVWNINKP
jgi:hypothetical protein